ncbi:putative adenylate/guanylate cyclase with Chase sensor [Megalodesulfovibrio gigas DSM 1382 = ATCC 19364]|uniref:Putative adenylate/guanylate cyclase with Chase sensor n=1 Tax=Megalodesulfovibrio gigas (strain ATCC 19364 / DSM 1382 / NCIMB 9332 / VKM B-1759) TaxID=1121448 RepID=T2G8J2_MEGG1|nr:putative adenylate/guanylate cyclase with Chase sensor [Megalodesulfovibrio gigas DSM 1382 = ATCC 19364]
MLSSRWRRVILAALAGVALVALLQQQWFYHTWEDRTWDWRVRLLAAPGAATDQIRLVLLDQDSLAWAEAVYGVAWPWPREFYAAIVSWLHGQGARAVAFDVLFTENQARDRPEDDAALVQAVATAGTVVGALFLGRDSGDAVTWPEGVRRPQLTIQGLADMPAALAERLAYPRAAFPFPELGNALAMLGTVQAQGGEDGVVRQVPLISLFGGHVVPSLGLAPLLVGAQQRWISLNFQDRFFEVDGVRIPIDHSAEALLRFRGPAGTHTAYSAAQVLQSMDPSTATDQTPAIADPDAFRNRYVFFGFSAPGLMDLRTAPVGGAYPGVEFWATLLDNLLSGDALRKADPLLAWATVLGCCLLAALAGNVFVSAWSQAAALAVVAPLPVVGSFVAYQQGLWLPMVGPVAGALGAFTMSSLMNYAMEGQQKRFIKNAFQQYLHPAVIEQLIQHPEKLTLGGERRMLSIFFSDLEGFTTLSENLDAETVTRFLNNYLSAMTDIILEEGGTVDKYEGDAIIAFWNAPLDQPDHAARALRAALRCQQRLEALRPGYQARLGAAPRMRIGVNTGEAIVGNLGSSTRFDYTMISDAVNLAARLESLNKQFGTYTMCSAASKEACGTALEADACFRELGRVQVKGKARPVVVHELLGQACAQARAGVLTQFRQGLDAFYAGTLQAASRIFEAIADQDPAAAAYAEKCRDLLAVTPSPAPDDWTGVWVMTSK